MKRMFQILDEMNLADGANGTANVIIGNQIVSADYGKAGTKVTIGIGGNQVNDIMSGKKAAILVIIDMDEYNKLKQ